MTMKQTINEHTFREAFVSYGRGDQFSHEALGLLYDWFEEYDECSGTESELDVIAICCEFSEEPLADVASNYSIEGDDDEILEHLNDNTLVVGQTECGDVIYAAY